MDLKRSGILAMALVAVAAQAEEPGGSDAASLAEQTQQLPASAENLTDTTVGTDVMGTDVMGTDVMGTDEMGIDDIDPAVSTSVLTADAGPGVTSSGVMDELDLSRTEIIGNQELPKVLYIVPWKKSDPGEITGKPVNTLLDEVLAPVDRTEFLRQVDYYGDVYGADEQ